MLLKAYSTPDKASKLFNFVANYGGSGSIDTLYPTIAKTKQEYVPYEDDYEDDDWDDDYVETWEYKTERELVSEVGGTCFYFKNGKWYAKDYDDYSSDRFVLVEKALKEYENENNDEEYGTDFWSSNPKIISREEMAKMILDDKTLTIKQKKEKLRNLGF